MLHINIPSREEYTQLADVRADACVSIYLETSVLRQQLDRSRIQLGNYITEAVNQLRDRDFDKRRLALLEDELMSVLQDPSFWDLHARSVAILATPDCIRTYRLPTELTGSLHVSDRFYLKPMLRALTFSNAAYILTLSANEARLIEFFADEPAEEVDVPGMPRRKSEAMSEAAWNDHQRDQVSLKYRAAQYTRQIDTALRPIFANCDYPLILAATKRTASIYRSTNTLPNLVDETYFGNTEHYVISNLVREVRPILDNHYQAKKDALKEKFDQRAGQGRVSKEFSSVAKAATFGAIDTLLINLDSTLKGLIDDRGLITYCDGDDITHCLVDEIARRALATGATVKAVRSEDLPEGADVHAILRWVF